MGALLKGYQIDRYRLLVLKSALKLEIKGMKKRGKSAYSIIKQEFNLKGNKQKVLNQLNDIIKEANNGIS